MLISKDISNDTICKVCLFYVFYPSTKLLKVIKKMEGMDQHPLRASVPSLMHQAGVHLGRGSSGLGKGSEKSREWAEAAGEEQPMLLTGQTDSPFSKSAAHNMPSCI